MAKELQFLVFCGKPFFSVCLLWTLIILLRKHISQLSILWFISHIRTIEPDIATSQGRASSQCPICSLSEWCVVFQNCSLNLFGALASTGMNLLYIFILHLQGALPCFDATMLSVLKKLIDRPLLLGDITTLRCLCRLSAFSAVRTVWPLRPLSFRICYI